MQVIERNSGEKALDVMRIVDFWQPAGVIAECGGGMPEISRKTLGDLPVVYLDEDPCGQKAPALFVNSDAVQIGEVAARELLALRLKHYAFLGFQRKIHWSERRRDAFVRDPNPAPVTERTPAFRNIQINNIIAKNITSCAGFIDGLPESLVENIQFTNCTVSMDPNGAPAVPAMADQVPEMQQAGFYVRRAKGIVFNNVVLKGVKGNIYDLDSTADVTIR